MYIILVVIFVNTLVNAEDFSEETKYIDLLPEKEKKEFLERIARRIFNQVQSKDDRDRASEEISDTQLDEHDEFVKKIYEEESLNLRKNVGETEDKNNKDRANDESLDMKSNSHDTIDDADNVDLTLRAGKRNKRNNIDIKNSEIIHVNAGSNKELKKTENADSKRDKNESDVEDIQIKYYRRDKAEEDLKVTTQKSEFMMTQMVDFEDDVAKSNSEEVIADPEDIKNTSKTLTQPGEVDGNKHDDKNIKNQTIEDTPKDSRENLGVNNIADSNNNDVGKKEFGFTQKIYDSQETRNNDTDSTENDVTEAIVSNNISEVTITDEKSTKVTTEKYINSNVTEIKKNISYARLQRSYTEGATLDVNKKPVALETINNAGYHDKKIDIKDVLPMTDEKHNLESKMNPENETEAFKNDLVHFKENIPDVSSIDLLPTSTTIKREYTTKNTDVVYTTTTKNDIFTTVVLRTDAEPKDGHEIISKEIIAEKNNTKSVEHNESGKSKNISSKYKVGDEIINERLYTNISLKDNVKKDEIKEVGDIKSSKINNDDSITEKNGTEIDKNSYSLTNDIIKILRTQTAVEQSSNEKNFDGLRAMYEATNPKEYNVYEVPTGQQPFIQKGSPAIDNKENPYYVPIYNYSPNNAYYDPHNRLGPNADDERNIDIIDNNNDKDDHNYLHKNKKYAARQDINKSDDFDEFSKHNVDMRSNSFESNEKENERKFKFGISKNIANKMIPYKLNLPVVVQYPKFTDIILNSNDYLDTDYYYGRSQNIAQTRNRCEVEGVGSKPIFPDSNEEDHPFNSRNLKNHLSAARLAMYKQKVFGNIPEQDKEPLRTRSNVKQKQVKPTSDKSIAIDYFFGRMDNPDTYKFERSEKKLVDSDPLKFLHNIETPFNEEDNQTRLKTKIIKKPHNFFGRVDDAKATIHLKNRPSIPLKFFHNVEALYNKEIQNVYSNNHNKKKDKYFKQQNVIPYKKETYLYVPYEINPVTPAIDVKSKDEYKFVNDKENLRDNKKKKVTDFETMKNILSISDGKDLVPTLDKLLKMNLTTTTNTKLRSKYDVDLEPFETVLEDMARNSARGLTQYDWLGTTVDIQAALTKVIDMIEALENNATLSQPDLQLIKYIIYLHKSLTKEEKDSRKSLIPRNKKKRMGIIKDRGLLNRHWLYRMLVEVTMNEDMVTEEDLDSFREFINDLQYYLYDLHTAIQQISTITKYKKQRWFENLKELYLYNNRKNILELLLHISTSRFLTLIEDSAKKGLEDDFLTYVMKNEKEIERTKEEMMFALKIIEELKMITY